MKIISSHPYLRKLIPLIALLSLVLAGCAENRTDGTGSSGKLTKIVVGNPTSNPDALFMNIVIGEQLGYFEEEGIDIEFKYLGSNAAVQANLEKGSVQFGIMNPFSQITAAGKSGEINYTNLYQYTFKSKWQFVVPEGSTIKSLSQMEGKTLALVGLNSEDQSIAELWLKSAGVNPDDVELKVVGNGAPMGSAIQDHEVDAALAWDSTLGQFDVSNIDYTVLPDPDGVPTVGGFSISTMKDYLSENKDIAAGVGRAVAKASVYADSNLTAAAGAYNKMYPSSVPAGKTEAQAAKHTAQLVYHRAKAWVPPNRAEYGKVREAELRNDIKLAGELPGVKSTSALKPESLYDNSLVGKYNDFDKSKIAKRAKEHKFG